MCALPRHRKTNAVFFHEQLKGNEEILAEIQIKSLSRKKYSKEIAACTNMLELVKAGIADKARATKVAFRVRLPLEQWLALLRFHKPCQCPRPSLSTIIRLIE